MRLAILFFITVCQQKPFFKKTKKSVRQKTILLENKADLSRVQKTACKVMLKNRFTSYEKALEVKSISCISALSLHTAWVQKI